MHPTSQLGSHRTGNGHLAPSQPPPTRSIDACTVMSSPSREKMLKLKDMGASRLTDLMPSDALRSSGDHKPRPQSISFSPQSSAPVAVECMALMTGHRPFLETYHGCETCRRKQPLHLRLSHMPYFCGECIAHCHEHKKPNNKSRKGKPVKERKWRPRETRQMMVCECRCSVAQSALRGLASLPVAAPSWYEFTGAFKFPSGNVHNIEYCILQTRPDGQVLGTIILQRPPKWASDPLIVGTWATNSFNLSYNSKSLQIDVQGDGSFRGALHSRASSLTIGDMNAGILNGHLVQLSRPAMQLASPEFSSLIIDDETFSTHTWQRMASSETALCGTCYKPIWAFDLQSFCCQSCFLPIHSSCRSLSPACTGIPMSADAWQRKIELEAEYIDPSVNSTVQAMVLALSDLSSSSEQLFDLGESAGSPHPLSSSSSTSPSSSSTSPSSSSSSPYPSSPSLSSTNGPSSTAASRSAEILPNQSTLSSSSSSAVSEDRSNSGNLETDEWAEDCIFAMRSNTNLSNWRVIPKADTEPIDSFPRRHQSSKDILLYKQHRASISSSPISGSLWQAYHSESSDSSSPLACSPASPARSFLLDVPIPSNPEPEPEKTPSGIIISDGHIRGGTLDELVRCIFDPPAEIDRNLYESAFRLTYASFTNPAELIHLLSTFYTEAETICTPPSTTPPKVFRLRICNFYKNWLQAACQDMRPSDIAFVAQFANNMVRQIDGDTICNIVLDALVKVSSPLGKLSNNSFQGLQFATAPPTPLPPSRSCPTFLDINPIELARQMTLMQHHIYRSITPLECMDKAWTLPEKEVRAPTISKLIKVFNLHSAWVISLIVTADDISTRARIVEHMIAVAQNLRMLKNFLGLNAIISGLGNIAVRRLSKTWEKVPKSKVHALQEQMRLMNPAKNFSEYRTALKESVSHAGNSGIIPFIGTFLTDLVFIDEGNSDFLKEAPTFINFTKRQLCATVINKIMLYTREPYNLAAVPTIQNFLNQLSVLSEDERYSRSQQIEPRMPVPESSSSSSSSKSSISLTVTNLVASLR